MNSIEAQTILNIKPPLNPDSLKAAYRAAAKKTHPDMGGSTEAFKKVNEAHQLLKNHLDRQNGKAALNSEQSNPFAGTPYDIYWDILRRAGFQPKTRQENEANYDRPYNKYANPQDNPENVRESEDPKDRERWAKEKNRRYCDVHGIIYDIWCPKCGERDTVKDSYTKEQQEFFKQQKDAYAYAYGFERDREAKKQKASHLITCKDCEGSGAFPGKLFILCPGCHKSSKFGCFICKEQGVIKSKGETCIKCKGTGKVPFSWKE